MNKRRSAPVSGASATVAALCFGGTVSAMQQTILVPVLPDLPHLLGTSADNVSWLVTATLLAAAITNPVASRLADMYGKKTVMLWCLVVMITGSLLGALTHDLAGGIAARALQGVGVALIPIGMSIMRDVLPADRMPMGVALMSATLALGGSAALPLAGLVVQHADWRVLFWITAGGGMVALAFAAGVVPSTTIRSDGRFDLLGAALLSVALVALLLALTKSTQWGLAATLCCSAAGILAIGVWIPLQLRTADSLVDLRVAARPAVLFVNIATAFAGFGMFVDPLVTTHLLQSPPLGLDPATVGLLMAPTSVAFGAAAPLSAWVTRRRGAHVTFIVGALSMGAAYVLRIWLDHDIGWIIAGSLLVSAGASLAFGAMPALIMREVPVTHTTSANGINALVRSIGISAASAAVAITEVPLNAFWGAAAACGIAVVMISATRSSYALDRSRVTM
ncbi:MFS transporter [Lentzea sp. NPDC051838]|uniref:MFS transporter n=1 Tax=Lentzea sp. NPDC051838 TaxID=3154849 RepID=UPI003442AA22